jgi:hypothetical protein
LTFDGIEYEVIWNGGELLPPRPSNPLAYLEDSPQSSHELEDEPIYTRVPPMDDDEGVNVRAAIRKTLVIGGDAK